jgi:hypothetical protein
MSLVTTSKLGEPVLCTITWQTALDDRVCPICNGLLGVKWEHYDIFEPLLIHSTFGPVWDLDANRSLVHSDRGNCRCFLIIETEINEKDIILSLSEQLRVFKMTATPTDLQELRANIRSLNQDMGALHWQILEINMVIGRFTTLAKRAGMPPEVQEALDILNRLRVMIWSTIYAFRMMAAAQMGAGPLGWALAGAALVGTALTFVDLSTEASSR